jgi:hypothetical protein
MASDQQGEVPADLRTSYQVAASLYMQENTLTWARFNAMLAANGILLTATTFALRERFPALLLALLLPGVGVTLCQTWREMMDRGFTYSDTWRESALQLERLLSPRVKTLAHGEQLRALQGSTRYKRARQYAERVITTFLVVYGLIFLIAIGQVINLYV